MYRVLSARPFVILAVFLVVINIFVLGGVIHNRSGNITSITLTERELNINYSHNDENSGRSLRINFRVLPREDDFYYGYPPHWLDQEKLESLGFEINLEDTNDANFFQVLDEKEVYIALEFDGEAYAQMLSNVKRQTKQRLDDPENRVSLESIQMRLEKEELESSRLFAIDASLTIEALQQNYANQDNVIIVKGIVSEPRNRYDPNEPPNTHGTIKQLVIEDIHLALEYSKRLEGLEKTDYSEVTPPRYTVDLAIGKNLSPYITEVSLISE